MTEINEQYVREYLFKQGIESVPQENIARLIATMKKYGTNRWWESNNPVILAYHQLHEDTLMVDLDTLYKGTTKICGRPVFSHDLWMDRENLMKEVEAGMRRLKNGTNLSEEVQEATINDSLGRLEKKVKQRGGKVIRVNPNPEESDTSGYDGWLKS